MVLVSHFGLSLHYPHLLWALANCYGKVGLRVFYVLSGFLITHLLLRERGRSGSISLKNFYIRRAYRILPAAYLYMIVVATLFYKELRAKDIALAFTYLSSYSTYIPHNLSHLWSLSVEEQFYLVWPAVMAAAASRERRIAIGVAIAAPIARFVLMTGGWGNGLLFPVTTSIDALAMGCLLALLQMRLEKWRGLFAHRHFWIVWLFTGVIPLLDLTRHGRLYQVAGLPLLHAGIALCMQNAIIMGYRVLNTSVSMWIGSISYSLYLWHRLFDDSSSQSWYTLFPANVVLMVGAAVASYYLVERPMLNLRAQRVVQLSSSEADQSGKIGIPSALPET